MSGVDEKGLIEVAIIDENGKLQIKETLDQVSSVDRENKKVFCGGFRVYSLKKY